MLAKQREAAVLMGILREKERLQQEQNYNFTAAAINDGQLTTHDFNIVCGGDSSQQEWCHNASLVAAVLCLEDAWTAVYRKQHCKML